MRVTSNTAADAQRSRLAQKPAEPAGRPRADNQDPHTFSPSHTNDSQLLHIIGSNGNENKLIPTPKNPGKQAIIPITTSQLDLIMSLDTGTYNYGARTGETVSIGTTSFIFLGGSYKSTLVSGDNFATLLSTTISAVVQAQTQITTINPRNIIERSHSPTFDLIDFSAYAESPSHISEPASLVPEPTLNSPVRPFEKYISRGCRQHILSTLRAYPRMMTKSSNLPPFIHRMGCGLYFNEQEAWKAPDSYTTDAFAPLNPLAACIDIARIFCSGSPKSNEFLWRSIDNEQKRISDELPQYSNGEILAAMQASLIYIIMQLISFGPEHFKKNRDWQNLNKRSCLRLRKPEICNISPPHLRSTRPTWEEWIFEETQRRTTVVSFLLALEIGSEPCNVLADPRRITVPGEKALWEANTRSDWEREYSASLAGRSQPPIETMSDLAIAKYSSEETAAVISDGMFGSTITTEEFMDDWYAGLDSLGMAFAAVLARI
ncbi:hypothetical protein DM02DRAFT_670214 [Periconia macrospinosa]|uniref:Transcription factor domain-containing protein n=1 Tax=Periconia macrospinosa TaxID=97972 RepID=A0A2V1E0X2_9PLEO|nr:hypothetical protein DM02DRAFT_670214 [Periconia macrospinosa]